MWVCRGIMIHGEDKEIIQCPRLLGYEVRRKAGLGGQQGAKNHRHPTPEG